MENKRSFKVHIMVGKASVHLCYIPADLQKQFVSQKGNLNEHIKNWFKVDFNTVITDRATLNSVKQAILNKYDALHPDLLPSTHQYDRYGWVRLWLVEHMKRELNDE